MIENNLDISSLKTCDLFGGTGSISYELCSRGAADCTIVEKDPAMFDYIRNTARELKLGQLHPVKMDVFKFISRCNEKFDFIFAGPPYALRSINEIPVKIVEHRLLAPNGWFILEHTPGNNYADYPLFVTSRNYGTTIFSIFVNK